MPIRKGLTLPHHPPVQILAGHIADGDDASVLVAVFPLRASLASAAKIELVSPSAGEISNYYARYHCRRL
jgi:hypothetical protein